MEFQGRIAKVLPIRSGISQRTGNEWKSLPFVFEYFENDTDRYADSVVLESFDEKVINNMVEGMEVRCGFGHHVRTFTKQDGTEATINELRLYKIECVKMPAAEATGTSNKKPAADATGNGGEQADMEEKQDDLPF